MVKRKSVFRLAPIGFVKRDEVIVKKKWSRALDGIEEFSHLIVVTWLDRAKPPEMKIHPKGSVELPKIGYLATRTQHRTNPIGVTVAKLRRRKGLRLELEGLDIWDGTPVIDLKPYTRRESVKNFKIPAWVKRWDKKETDPLRRYAS